LHKGFAHLREFPETKTLAGHPARDNTPHGALTAGTGYRRPHFGVLPPATEPRRAFHGRHSSGVRRDLDPTA
jgi:hypothetical protein